MSENKLVTIKAGPQTYIMEYNVNGDKLLYASVDSNRDELPSREMKPDEIKRLEDLLKDALKGKGQGTSHDYDVEVVGPIKIGNVHFKGGKYHIYNEGMAPVAQGREGRH